MTYVRVSDDDANEHGWPYQWWAVACDAALVRESLRRDAWWRTSTAWGGL